MSFYGFARLNLDSERSAGRQIVSNLAAKQCPEEGLNVLERVLVVNKREVRICKYLYILK